MKPPLLADAIVDVSETGSSLRANNLKIMHVVLKLLPEHATPTVSTLSDPDWLELSIVVEEKFVRELIPSLYQAGARGIIELPINKIVE